MIILIPIETSNRELLYKVYLSHLLAQKGFKCYLGNKSNIAHLILKFDSYIYLDKGYHKGVSDKIYEIIKSKNGKIINLDEEGGVDYPDNSTLLGRYSEALFSSSELVFLWGNHQLNITEKNIKDKRKVFVTGHPRFELLKSNYHLFYEDDVEQLKKKYGDFFLVNTNMGFGNNIKGDEFVINNYGNRFSNINKKIEFDKKKIEIFIPLIKKLSSETPKNIIVRPHPEENADYYKKAFDSFKNVHVIYEGSVIPWLIASEIMIHPDCTTAIESLLIGKKAISFLPEKYDTEIVTNLPLEASYKFNNEDDVVSFIKNESYINEAVDLMDYQFVEEYFSFSRESSELIVDTIAQQFPLKEFDLLDEITLKDNFCFFYHYLTSRISKNTTTKLIRNKLNGFSYNEIIKIHNRIKNINPQCRSIKIKKVSEVLFMFYTAFNKKQN
ncbi:MAG: hypothetical protein KF721_09525 [Ignavibacteriaceae bacterium]|nr:hypothetical protein [Ignavibacteriaceae bacterium]